MPSGSIFHCQYIVFIDILSSFIRATIENVEVMKEEVQTMKRKTQNYESLQDKVAQLQVENEVSSLRISACLSAL